MNEKPTYDELLSANEQLKARVDWLEGVYNSNRDGGMLVKSRFLSNLTHEIRTPMNAIQGFSSLLRNEEITENERDEYVDFISQNSHSLLKVMDNIIDLSLLEGEGVNLKKDEVFVENLMEEIYQYYNSRISRMMQYRVALLLTMPNVYGKVKVQADGRRLRRMIENLVSSAIMNQKKGVVELKMDVEDEKFVKMSVIMEYNELLAERAKMVFENNGKQDDWYNHLDTTGLAYKLALDLAKAMGGSVSLVQGVCKRMSICIALPIFDSKPIQTVSKSNLSTMLY